MINKPKVLWLNNTILPEITKAFNAHASFTGGWITGLFNVVKHDESIDLTVVFPMYAGQGVKKIVKDDITYYGVGIPVVFNCYHKETEHIFKQILKEEKPDMVHVFGTEFPHSLAMVKAYNKPNRTLISIQGLTSVYPYHYLEGIPFGIIRSKTLPEWLFGRGLEYERDQFAKRKVMEIEAVQKVGHVTGRTEWDKACTAQMNPKVKYHFCNESLRDSFYQKTWDIRKIEKHSLFVSQGTYPIKGLHLALQALVILRKDFSDVKLYVGGGNMLSKKKGIRRLVSKRSYPTYIADLIKQNNLEKNVVFLGSLDEVNMRDRYLKTHVFVSPSTIENSPNSVGEANILGVPCVATDVGGVTDMMVHKKEGFVYPATAHYMLAHYAKKLFLDDELCKLFSVASKKHASVTHNRQTNGKTMIKIYTDILAENE